MKLEISYLQFVQFTHLWDFWQYLKGRGIVLEQLWTQRTDPKTGDITITQDE